MPVFAEPNADAPLFHAHVDYVSAAPLAAARRENSQHQQEQELHTCWREGVGGWSYGGAKGASTPSGLV